MRNEESSTTQDGISKKTETFDSNLDAPRIEIKDSKIVKSVSFRDAGFSRNIVLMQCGCAG